MTSSECVLLIYLSLCRYVCTYMCECGDIHTVDIKSVHTPVKMIDDDDDDGFSDVKKIMITINYLFGVNQSF